MKKFSHKLRDRDSPSFQRSYFGALHNLVRSGQWEKYYELLTDYNFLSSKIRYPDFGLQPLINDYDLIAESEIEIPPQKLKVLKLIQGALQLSSHVLRKDITQLSAQLWGRLLYYDKLPEIKHLLESAKQHQTKPWVCSLVPSLNPPGGRLSRTLTGHSGAVLALTVTPDGEKIISGSEDKTLKIWNLQTGEEIRTFKGHTGFILAIAVTPDGKKIISGSEDRTLKIWNLQTGEEIRTLKGHSSKVTTVAVTPDGTRVVSGSWDNTVRVWDLEIETETETETGEEIFTLNDGYCKLINAVVVTPDSKKAISASSDFTLVVWSLETGNKLFTLSGHKDTVSSLAITPDGKRVVSGSWDKTIKVWSIESERGFLFWLRNLILGRDIFTLTSHRDRVTVVVATPDGKHIISDSLGCNIKIWDLETGKEIDSLKEHIDEVNPLAVTPDAKLIISASKDNTLKVWSLAKTKEEVFTHRGHNDIITNVKVTSNGKQVVSISSDNTIKVWDLYTGNEIFTLQKNINRINSVSLTLNGKYLIFDSDKNKCEIWDIYAKKILFNQEYLERLNISTITKNNLVITANNLATTANKLYFISRSKVSYILMRKSYKSYYETGEYDSIVWDVFTGERLFILENYDYLANQFAALAPDMKKFISSSQDNMITRKYTLKIWSLETGEELQSFREPIPQIKALTITPNSSFIITGLADKTIKVWNINTQKIILNLSGYTHLVNALTVSPDSKKFISGFDNKNIKAYNLETGEELFHIVDENYEGKIAITPNGKWLISSGHKNQYSSFKAWNLSTGEELFYLGVNDKNTLIIYDYLSQNIIASFTIDDNLECFDLAPDGKTIVAGDESGRLHFLYLEALSYYDKFC